jgi:uncharacterized protein YrrD
MPKTSTTEHLPLLNAEGKRVGRIGRVLFHPSEPRVVGYEVEPRPYLGLIDRRSRYVPFGQVAVDKDGKKATFDGKRLPITASSAKKAGFEWETTVVYTGMPVRTESEREIGRIGTVTYGKKSGKVRELTVTDGLAADATVGRIEVEGELVVGFDGEWVVVKEAVREKGAEGSLAAYAGAGSAVAKDAAERAALAAARAGGRAFAKLKGLTRDLRNAPEDD